MIRAPGGRSLGIGRRGRAGGVNLKHRIRTLHILTSLDRRGAETFAVQMVDRLSRDLFHPAIWTIRQSTDGTSLDPERTPVLTGLFGRRGGLKPLGPLRELVGVIRAYRPHVVHCHGGRAFKLAMMVKPVARAPVYVYTKIGSVHPWLDPPLKRLVFARFFEQLDAVVCVGEEIRQEVFEMFHPRRPRLMTIYTGRDVTPFERATPDVAAARRAELGLTPDDVCVMTVGSVSWEKDPERLLRLFTQLLPQAPRLRLVFVGDGPLLPTLRAQVATAGVEDKVRLLGVRTDVPALLTAADVFALTSLTEGLPGVLIEAGMAGCPSVAFGVGAMREVLKDGSTGFVVPPGDDHVFSQRLLTLAEDPALREQMGSQARTLIRRDFDIRWSVRRHEALFIGLLQGSRHPRVRERAAEVVARAGASVPVDARRERS